MFVGNAVKVAVVDLTTGEGLNEAFLGQDTVVEVISNDQRPAGVEKIIAACEL